MKNHIVHPLPDIEYVYSNNTKLSQVILKNGIACNGNYHPVNVFDEVSIRVALHNKVDNNFYFKPIDILILNAIGSLYDNGICTFTTEMIARIMFHNRHHRISKNVLDEVRTRIQSMRNLTIRFDLSAEISARASLPTEARLRNRRYCSFLPCKDVDIVYSINRKHGQAFRFRQYPPLWAYAKYTSQIIRCKFGSLHLENHSTSIESLLILQAVYNRIEEIKYKDNGLDNHKISFSWYDSKKVEHGLLPECYINPAAYKNWNDKHRKICALIESFLDKMKNSSDKRERIEDYHPYKNIGSQKNSGYYIQLKKSSNKYKKKKEN